METFAWQTGLTTVWADVLLFLTGVRFARPPLLWLALWPVALVLMAWMSSRMARRRLALLGRPGAVAGLLTDRQGTRWQARVAFALGWWALVLGVAGPRWGKGDDGGVAVGRDVVVVLDFSRSMLADDMADGRARWRAAVGGVHELLESSRATGGHRLGLVVFAARPVLVVPLTTDYDHLAVRLDDLSAELPPNEVRPLDDTAKSGTRIGAALALAVAAHDGRFPGAQDILLFSDGDDPAKDREWAAGVTAARAANIPIHVVGVGDPTRGSPIPFRGELLERDGVFIETKLHEDVLRATATEGHGEYIPARRDPPPVSDFLAGLPDFPRVLTDDAAPQPVDRAVWFLAAAFVFLLFWLWRAK